MAQLELHDLTVFYPGQETPALRGVTASLEAGEFVTLCGRSGSGKSTLLRCCKPALAPQGTRRGEIFWAGRPLSGLSDRAQSASIGYVGQSPENQMVTDRVWQELAFGPENLGLERELIGERIVDSLQAVGLANLRQSDPTRMSGGQQQRASIAGMLAMNPAMLVLDEPTAMLDPNGRKEVLAAVHQLNKQENVTVVLITHYMEEVIDADHVIVMDDGHVVMEGTPREIFSQVETLKKYRLDVPQVTLLAHELKQSGVEIPDGILTTEELVNALCQ